MPRTNVARSLMVVRSKLGMNLLPAVSSAECMPADDVIEACKPIAEANGWHHHLTQDPKEACTGASRHLHRRLGFMGEPDEV